MELNINQVRKMDSNKIFEKLLLSIDKMYTSFLCIDIPKNKYYELVLKIIDNSKTDYDGTIDYSEYIIEKINLLFNKTMEVMEFDPDKIVSIMDNYINNINVIPSNYKNSFKIIKELSTKLLINNAMITPDVLSTLIKENKKISTCLEIILKNQYNSIKSGDIDYIFDFYPNNSFIAKELMETYCMMNNINMGDEISELEIKDTSNISDNLKIYLKDMKKYPLLSQDEYEKLIEQLLLGNIDAKKKLVEHNLRLVLNIAYKFQGRGMELQDLIQEGNVGLMKAADRFDPTLGLKFSTYATWWIKQSITRGISNKSTVIRVPVHMEAKLQAYKKARAQLEFEFGSNPPISEIAKIMNISVSSATRISKYFYSSVSIDSKIGKDKDTALHEFIADKESFEENIDNKIVRNGILDILNNCSLKDRERDILLSRLGFNDEKVYTLQELADKYGLTRERVRQLESKAIDKVKSSKTSDELKQLLLNIEEPQEPLQINKTIYQDLRINRDVDISEAILKLSKFDQEIIRLHYGNDLRIPQASKLSIAQRKYLKSNIIPKLKQNIVKKKTIYNLLSNYQKDAIDKAILALSNDEQELIKLRYGDNLEQPQYGNLTEKQKSIFYNRVIPKLKEYLNPNYRKPNTIYHLFQNYPEKEIDKALLLLSEKEKKLIDLRYANGFDEQIVNNLNQKEKGKFYREVVPKIKSQINANSKNVTIYNLLSDYSKDEIDKALATLSEKEQELVKLRYGNNLKTPEESKLNAKEYVEFYKKVIPKLKENMNDFRNIVLSGKSDKTKSQEIDTQIKSVAKIDCKESNLTKENYIEMLDLLKTPMFSKMLESLTAKEAIIISLKIGYIDNKCFTNESISNFLNISLEEVESIIFRVMMLYKNNVNDSLDKLIENIDSTPKEKIKCNSFKSS